jgi:hypothetical protein
MRFFSFLFLLVLGILTVVSGTDNGKTTDVTWDKYSLSVKGERLFIFSGEFHYARLPVPEMWLDVFQKLKANGFNAISGESTSLSLAESYAGLIAGSVLLLELPQRLGGRIRL